MPSKVLHNIENLKPSFKVRYKDGTVTVSSITRFFKQILSTGDELKKEMQRKLSIYDYAKKWFTGTVSKDTSL